MKPDESASRSGGLTAKGIESLRKQFATWPHAKPNDAMLDELCDMALASISERGAFRMVNGVREPFLSPHISALVTDGERYRKLRALMTRNLPETWNRVEEIAAVGCWEPGWPGFDAEIDALPAERKD